MRRTQPFRNQRPPTQILRVGKSTRENPRRLSGSTHRHRAHKGSADPQLSVVTSLIATPVAAVNERQPTMSASTPHAPQSMSAAVILLSRKNIEEGPEGSALGRPVGDGERDVGERAAKLVFERIAESTAVGCGSLPKAPHQCELKVFDIIWHLSAYPSLLPLFPTSARCLFPLPRLVRLPVAGSLSEHPPRACCKLKLCIAVHLCHSGLWGQCYEKPFVH